MLLELRGVMKNSILFCEYCLHLTINGAISTYQTLK